MLAEIKHRKSQELMRVLFRDLYRYPIVEQIRKANNDTTNIDLINREFQDALDRTLFLGVGNPSESGCHLLYYFRQEMDYPRRDLSTAMKCSNEDGSANRKCWWHCFSTARITMPAR